MSKIYELLIKAKVSSILNKTSHGKTLTYVSLAVEPPLPQHVGMTPRLYISGQ